MWLQMEGMDGGQDKANGQKVSEKVCSFTSAEIIKTKHWC